MHSMRYKMKKLRNGMSVPEDAYHHHLVCVIQYVATSDSQQVGTLAPNQTLEHQSAAK